MTTPEPPAYSDTDAKLHAIGIPVTEAGKAEWRERLRQAAAKRTPELRAKWREQAGMPAEQP